MCQKVLEKSRINKAYSFPDASKADSFGGRTIRYLGSVQIKGGHCFKVLTYTFTGTRLNTGEIYIYNQKNQFVGKYELGDASDLPDRLENGSLIFTNNDNSSCDKSLVTVISLRK